MDTNFAIEKKLFSIDLKNIQDDFVDIKSSPLSYKVLFMPTIANINQHYKNKYLIEKQNRFIIWDENVFNLYGKSLIVLNDTKFVLSAIEENKCIDTVLELIDKLQNISLTKKELIVSIGGGITQDITAFTRAIYKRGIDWSFIPTTLLSMADSCIGAKTALNHKAVKNQLALFSAPKEVIVCPEFLNSLSSDEIFSGYGEILKLVIIGGEIAINEFEKIINSKREDNQIIVALIKLSLHIKKLVIEEDEFELNLRRSLNYGHTFGHAIEPLVDYKVPHGIAVSIGMIIENRLSSIYGKLDVTISENYNMLIAKYIPAKYWTYIATINHEKLLMNIFQDKKTMQNTINMAVPFNTNEFGILKIDKTEFTIPFIKGLLNQVLAEYAK